MLKQLFVKKVLYFIFFPSKILQAEDEYENLCVNIKKTLSEN